MESGGSFTIACVTLQMWPANRAREQPRLTLTDYLEDEKEEEAIQHEMSTTQRKMTTMTTTSTTTTPESFSIVPTTSSNSSDAQRPEGGKNEENIGTFATTTSTITAGFNITEVDKQTNPPTSPSPYYLEDNITIESQPSLNLTSTFTSFTTTTLATNDTTNQTELTYDVEDNTTNRTSFMESIRQFNEEHPQVVNSLRLTLLPIALVSVLFVFV